MNTRRPRSPIRPWRAAVGLAVALPATWLADAPAFGPRPALAGQPDRPEAARAPSPAGQVGGSPGIRAHEFLDLPGRRIPLYGPVNDQGGLAADRTYVYPATIRVVSTRFDAASNVLDLTLSFNPPEVALAAAKARIEAKANGTHATLVPIPINRLEITVRDFASGEERTWVEDVGGPSGEFLPPARKLISWRVPADLPEIRRLLADQPAAVSVRVRVTSNFQEIARGIVRTGFTGVVSEHINDVVRPVGEDKTSSEVLVSREVLDKIRSTLEENLIYIELNSGLKAEEWEMVRKRLTRVVTDHFKSLPIENLAAVLDATDRKFFYRIGTTGQVEARPLLTKNTM